LLGQWFSQNLQIIEVLQPAPGNLQALTMSTGGTALPDAQAVKIATIVGATGGLIPQNDSGIYPGAAANAYGAFAGWTISTANYTSVTGGHPAALLTFNNGQLVSNYLYRNAVPGQPQLNQMNTALDMQGNNVNNVGQVNTATLAATGNATVGGTLGVTGTATSAKVALTDTVVEGAACGAVNGLVSKDASGLLLSCQSGVWNTKDFAPTTYGLNNLYPTLLLSTWMGHHKFCALSTVRSVDGGANTCNASRDSSGIWWLFNETANVTDPSGSWCVGVCFD
jgi:hypothetical protein